MSNTISPLYLPIKDTSLKYSDLASLMKLSRIERFSILCGSLLRKIGCFLFIDSPERLFLEKQLKSRGCFPVASWDSVELDIDFVKYVLSQIADCFFWPNYNFIPNDPLNLVFFENDFYPFGYEDFRDELKEMLDIDIYTYTYTNTVDHNLFELVSFLYPARFFLKTSIKRLKSKRREKSRNPRTTGRDYDNGHEK